MVATSNLFEDDLRRWGEHSQKKKYDGASSPGTKAQAAQAARIEIKVFMWFPN
jgi:hypothetical protein